MIEVKQGMMMLSFVVVMEVEPDMIMIRLLLLG